MELTTHAYRRIKECRQEGVTEQDVIEAALSIPGRIPFSTKFKNFIGAGRALFDLVILDKAKRRVVVSVIGKK